MYQSVTLIGRVAAKPELRYTPSGVTVASFSLAVNRTWTDSEGNKKDKTTWFRCSTWRQQAEVVEKYLDKGSKVMVIGEIEEARPFTDRDGNQRASLEVTTQKVVFLSNKGDSESGNSVANATHDDGPEIPF